MLDDTWPQYLFLRFVILVFQYLGPSCLVYSTWIVYNSWPQWSVTSAFRGWCAAESLFLLFFLWYRIHLQREAVHPPLRSKRKRKALFTKVRSEIRDPEKFFGGWFRGAKVEDIGREEMKNLLSWSFWDGRADVTPGGVDEEEMNYYLNKVEKMMRIPFKPGRGTAKPLMLTLDPIVMECRTLLWYGIIMLADTVTHVLMRRTGFQYFKTTSTSLTVCPPRPAAVMEKERSPADHVSYWIRPHTSKTRLPILYIHGIGVGLLPHIRFLHELDQALHSGEKSDGEVGVLAIEILQISSRLTHPILSRADFLRELTELLNFYRYDRFVMVSHSYGSVLGTHILTHEPLASRVSATLFIDPVTVLLHMPDVAYNFTVRPPKRANEWQMWYFASKDPGVAHTLGRHFFGSENLLWRDRIMELVQNGMRMTASLASKDLIVNTEAVGTYLTEHQVPDPVLMDDGEGRKQMDLYTRSATHWKQRPWLGTGLEVIWWEGLDHAQVFDQQVTRTRLVNVLVEYSRGD